MRVETGEGSAGVGEGRGGDGLIDMAALGRRRRDSRDAGVGCGRGMRVRCDDGLPCEVLREMCGVGGVWRGEMCVA